MNPKKYNVPWQSEEEIDELLTIYKGISKTSILEIGSLAGDTLKLWIQYGQPNSQIISIDLLDTTIYPGLEQQLQQDGHNGLWIEWAEEKHINFSLIENDSTRPETIKLVKILAPNGLDFVFIDGGHSYNTVKADFYNYWEMVNPGGVVALHDVAFLTKIFYEELQANGFRTKTIFKGLNSQDPPMPCGIGVVYKEGV